MINILSKEIYNKIAAGEVVDRPYSVVKELVENAIDAGASEITVEIEGGGKKKVRVTDNGKGISKEDLPRAYLPHATSKLKTAEDLFTVATLGFRGEALASIAAVSRMKIVSKTAEGNAYSLSSGGGLLGEVTEAAGANGTEVTVEDLFFNTPARLKFLKSDTQEEGEVSNMMARFLLSRPKIAFNYYVNGKLKYRSFGDGLDSALAAVYGAETVGKCYEISAEKHGIRIYGYLGNQNFSKPNRSYQSLFVNGRYVVNQTVGAAVTNAYGAYLMKRQYPFFVLFLDVPAEIVDVNVHPTKADVRFADNQIIYGCVYSVVSAVLDGNSKALEYLVSNKTEKGAVQEEIPLPKAEVRSTFPELKPQPQMSYEAAKKELAFDVSPVGGRTPAPRLFASDEPFTMKVNSPKPKEQEQDAFEENRAFLLEQEKKKQEKIDPATLAYKGELFRTFLIYEIGDDAYFIDQHAAHERLIYNRLVARTSSREQVSQPMLLPFVLSVNAEEYAFLVRQLPLLRELGFEVEEFGGTSLKVSAVPVDLQNIDLDAFFGEVLRSMETLNGIKLTDLLKDKLASAACKAAVKGGEFLTDDEAKSLITQMDGDMGLRCPHGRPVAVKMKKSELEKLFKRIV
ncbi:MAG: DNA mismatch repair endonuclease MutL [Clostridia bacterium]|nr:DNA mismatch repair endonuclease MutL [Clostridia bacterium]